MRKLTNRERDRPVIERPLKVEIIVHGRFHAFALAKAILALGHDPIVHTNYPAQVVERFGFPANRVRSFVTHGVVSRIGNRLERYLSKELLDRRLHTMFGRWAARSVRDDADILHGFSGVMEEVLLSPRPNPMQIRSVVRGSTHIEEQARLLREEEVRAGVLIEQPSDWMRAREVREYALADKIIVLSAFAARGFTERGFKEDQVAIVPLGVNVERFAANQEIRARRRRRVLEGEPLRVLTVGTFSFRKGLSDLIETAARLSDRMQFRFVGASSMEATHLLKKASDVIELVARVPEDKLADEYEWADVFLFPTIEDGFAAVLLQAAAAGLPIIATENCSARDFIREGSTGWIVPIRDPDALTARLCWCDENRDLLAQVADAAGNGYIREWSMAARDLVSVLSGCRKNCEP